MQLLKQKLCQELKSVLKNRKTSLSLVESIVNLMNTGANSYFFDSKKS